MRDRAAQASRETDLSSRMEWLGYGAQQSTLGSRGWVRGRRSGRCGRSKRRGRWKRSRFVKILWLTPGLALFRAALHALRVRLDLIYRHRHVANARSRGELF